MKIEELTPSLIAHESNISIYFDSMLENSFKMKDSEAMDAFMTQVIRVFNQLQQYEEDLSNKKVIEKVLRSFPKKIEAIVVSIEEFKDTNQTQIEALIGSLIAHESRLSRYHDSTLETSFKTEIIEDAAT